MARKTIIDFRPEDFLNEKKMIAQKSSTAEVTTNTSKDHVSQRERERERERERDRQTERETERETETESEKELIKYQYIHCLFAAS